MDLEKAYDRVDRGAMWEVLGLYGVGGRLLNAVKSFYINSRACVRIGNEVSDWFPVRVGLRQGCVMSPWLFNVYMDGVVREVNARILGRGLELIGADGGAYELSQLLFADDTALVADSEEKLCRLVTEFGRVCERRKLRVNINKSKVMSCVRNGNVGGMNVKLNGEMLEEEESFEYLGACVAANGGIEMEVSHRVRKGYHSLGAMKMVLKNRWLGMSAKRRLYEGAIVPTTVYVAETWDLRVAEKKRLNVLEMKCLRRMYGVNRLTE